LNSKYDTKQKLICELPKKFYLAGKKVVILVKDDEPGNELDHLAVDLETGKFYSAFI